MARKHEPEEIIGKLRETEIVHSLKKGRRFFGVGSAACDKSPAVMIERIRLVTASLLGSGEANSRLRSWATIFQKQASPSPST